MMIDEDSLAFIKSIGRLDLTTDKNGKHVGIP